VSTPIDERSAILAMIGRKALSWPVLARRVVAEGSALTVAEQEGLTAATLFDDGWSQDLAQAQQALEEWDGMGLRFLTVLDPEYPARLADVKQMPPFFFAQGSFDDRDARGVAVIGSRRASAASLVAASGIAEDLAEADVVVVSGLAAGIDTAAHRACLKAGGRTVAVIGTGITRSYPAENRDLQTQIAQTGLVVSQFLPDAPPSKISFPLRNELMSGWCWASCVVQADERSGARLQARVAIAQGRRLFFYRTMEIEAWARDYVAQGHAQFIDSALDILGERHGGPVGR
jgi:DNA processing protein